MSYKAQRLLKKILLAVLAKQPDSFGLVLQDGGWIEIKNLARAVKDEVGFRHVTRRVLEQYLLFDGREFFEISGSRVRARLDLQEPGLCEHDIVVPPPILFTAIRPKACQHVLAKGLMAGQEGYTVLCASKEIALRRGYWIHNKPVLVTVKSGAAYDSGTVFRSSGKDLFLVNYIDPNWISMDIPPMLKEKKSEHSDKKDKRSKKPPSNMPPDLDKIGTFIIDPDMDTHIVNSNKRLGKRKKSKKDPAWKQKRRRDRRR